jgi:protein DJ-1
VTIASLESSKEVMCSRNVRIVADVKIDQVQQKEFDIIILPGGLGGSETFAQDTRIKEALERQQKQNKWIAAICAAPIALKAFSIALGHRITSYPGKANEFGAQSGYNYSEDRVVIDRRLITSRGPGTAFEFALVIVEQLVGKAKADELRAAMLL